MDNAQWTLPRHKEVVDLGLVERIFRRIGISALRYSKKEQQAGGKSPDFKRLAYRALPAHELRSAGSASR